MKHTLIFCLGGEKEQMNSKEKFFNQADAWVFASLRDATDEKDFSFVSFLATADLLNHAIMTQEEIKQGFAKLYMRGLIKIDKENIKKTDLAETLYEKISKKRGGLFSVVGNCFYVLNSPRTKLPFINTPSDLEFVTPDYVDSKYKEYIDWTKSR